VAQATGQLTAEPPGFKLAAGRWIWMSLLAGFFDRCAPMNRKARDRKVAQEIADELTAALGPVAPEMLAANRDTVEEVFERVFDRHQIVTESAGANILKCVPRVLAKAAMPQRKVT
jgi:hypothetical protein